MLSHDGEHDTKPLLSMDCRKLRSVGGHLHLLRPKLVLLTKAVEDPVESALLHGA